MPIKAPRNRNSPDDEGLSTESVVGEVGMKEDPGKAASSVLSTKRAVEQAETPMMSSDRRRRCGGYLSVATMACNKATVENADLEGTSFGMQEKESDMQRDREDSDMMDKDSRLQGQDFGVLDTDAGILDRDFGEAGRFPNIS